MKIDSFDDEERAQINKPIYDRTRDARIISELFTRGLYFREQMRAWRFMWFGLLLIALSEAGYILYLKIT